MNEYINKRIKTAKVYRICFLVCLGLLFLGSYLLSVTKSKHYELLLLYTDALIVSAFVYYIVFHPLMKNIAWLKRIGKEEVINDITLSAPILKKSKIYFENRAIFSKKPCCIIPYEEVAWVYIREQKALLGLVTVNKEFIVRCRDGKTFALRAYVEEFSTLLEYIDRFSSNVIIGYGQKQQKMYAECRKRYKDNY